MSLIIIAVFDTEENKRSEYTIRTIMSLTETVDWSKHRLIVVDNNSCGETVRFLSSIKGHINFDVIHLTKNIGTAAAVNLGLRQRKPFEPCIKMDNDVVINQTGWVDEMQEALIRDPQIGILGLKRKDLAQTPYNTDATFKSLLIMLPHQPGQRWINVEKSNDIMGTCTMFNPALLDKIGYMYQPGLYGFDDTLMSLRSILAGFYNGFLNHINIDHIDVGDNPYIEVKKEQAGAVWEEFCKITVEYRDKVRPIYYDGGFDSAIIY